jgi:hypothetical protein
MQWDEAAGVCCIDEGGLHVESRHKDILAAGLETRPTQVCPPPFLKRYVSLQKNAGYFQLSFYWLILTNHKEQTYILT